MMRAHLAGIMLLASSCSTTSNDPRHLTPDALYRGGITGELTVKGYIAQGGCLYEDEETYRSFVAGYRTRSRSFDPSAYQNKMITLFFDEAYTGERKPLPEGVVILEGRFYPDYADDGHLNYRGCGRSALVLSAEAITSLYRKGNEEGP